MTDHYADWRVALDAWLTTHPKTIPSGLKKLRDEFVQRFPPNTLSDMAIDQFAVGKPDSFCYWLEFKTKDLGSISGGSSKKYGVYWGKDGLWHWNKIYPTAEAAFNQIKKGLVALVSAVENEQFDALDAIGAQQLGSNRYSLRCKPLALYFPDEFLPIANPYHVARFLRILGAEPHGDLMARNRQLLSLLSALPEFTGFDTQQMMHFLYDSFPVPSAAPTTKPDGSNAEEPSVDDEPTGMVAELLQLLTRTRNIILYGPPGTGKTYWVRQLAEYLLDDQPVGAESSSATPVTEYCEFVTFHQSFAYEEFVEGLKPLPPSDGGPDVRYAVVPGVFRRICRRAEEAWREGGDHAPRFLLAIDEINRANIAKVFGELITLVEDDKRLGAPNQVLVTLPYSGDVFGVPPNLYIVATMNTADRSIALLDVALRRRFAFVEVMPEPGLLHSAAGVDLVALLERLNRRLFTLLDRNYEVGHSYFLDVHDLPALRYAWYYRVVPLLQEYFAADADRLRAVLGKDFITEVKSAPGLFDTNVDWLDGDTSKVKINRYEDDDVGFVAALKHLSGVKAE